MRALDQKLMRELAAVEAPICLSLYLEVAAGGGEHDQIRIALKNAKDQAAEAIAAFVTENGDGAAVKAEVAKVRERLEALDYEDVVGGHDRHVTVFIGPDLTEIVDTPLDEVSVHLGPRFRLAPLLAHLGTVPEHGVLVVTEDRAEFFLAQGSAFSEQRVPGMPASLAEIDQFTEIQDRGNVYGRENAGRPGTGGGRRASEGTRTGPVGMPHHSMGGHDWHQDKERELREYANSVINAVGRHLSGSNTPLVIVADERLYGMLRENSEYPFLMTEGITIHPDEMDEEQLAKETHALFEREARQIRTEAWDKVAQSLGRGDREASEDPADIVTAAAAGRVAHLFARTNASLRGRFDAESLAAEKAEDGPEDLVDRAIVETLRNGGDVFPLGDRGGEETVLAAAYRYPA